MHQLRIGIIGMGHVGRLMADQLTGRADVVTYDLVDGCDYPAHRLARCDLSFVCVDTPANDDGSCDTSRVEAAIARLPTERVVIRSTVAPGTTDRLSTTFGRPLCHFPEFFGQGPHSGLPRPAQLTDTESCILGGPTVTRDEIVELLMPLFGPRPTWHLCTATESETIKYMENCFLATKVAFVNEFFDICKRLGVSWPTVREGWLLDPRIGRSHTAVFAADRGFSGACLPKDLAAMIDTAEAIGCGSTVLRAVQAANDRQRCSAPG